MDPETQQYLEMAKTGLDTANKTGLLKGIFSRLPLNTSRESPPEVVDFYQRALLALKENAVEYFAALELTGAEALQILGPNFSLDDLGKVDSTWQRHWTKRAGKVGIEDEERRTWWARLLAGEIQRPGTFSLRAMAVMDTLSSREAQLFTRLCDYVWFPDNPMLILPRDNSALWKPDFEEATMLENCGLVMSTLATYSLTSPKIRPTVSYLSMKYFDETFFIEVPPSQTVTLRRGQMQLTDVGKELYRLTSPQYSIPYRDEILSEWSVSYTLVDRSIIDAE